MEIKDKFWLIGFLEGEGSFLCGPPSSPNQPRVAATSTDEDVIVRATRLLNCSYHPLQKQKKHYKQAWAFQKSGSKAVLFMREIQPHMSLRRQGQIQKVLDGYNWNTLSPENRKISEENVLKIRDLCAEGKLKQGEIAELFAISREMVNKIYRRKKHVDV